MERSLTPDERIKRAEDIYYQRKIKNTNKKSARVNVAEKKDFRLFRKIVLQLCICLLIYVIFYMIKNTNYVFSDNILKKAHEILSYDININHLYEQAKECINGLINKKEETTRAVNEIQSNNSEVINEPEGNLVTENEVSSEADIGGESLEIKEENHEMSQMEQDAKYILENKSLIIPLKGTITSRFGLRNPSSPRVPKFHTGIDIAVNAGTVFISAMSGTVEEISSKRRFG